MSLYIVRVVGPSGVENFLCRGRLVQQANATRYSHPSAAYRASEAYFNKHPGNHFVVDVIDETDPERRI